MVTFGERLKDLRIENKLSQDALSKEVGYSQPAIARWESNKQKPNIDVIIVFAKYFKVTAGYLLGLED